MNKRAKFEDFGIDEQMVKKFIRLGIEGELRFEVMNNQKSRFQLLDERQLSEIHSSHPEKINLRLTDARFNPKRHTFDAYSYEQKVNYDDLWFEYSQFQKLLEKLPQSSQETPSRAEENDVSIKSSPYWVSFNKIACKAKEAFPVWCKGQRKIKVEEVVDWLRSTYDVTEREARVIANILSDFHKEINKHR